MLIVSCENCLVLEHVYFVFQPWAFPAREFLRKKLIGKEVCFTIENKTPQGREYGMIYLGKGEYQGGKGSFFSKSEVPPKTGFRLAEVALGGLAVGLIGSAQSSWHIGALILLLLVYSCACFPGLV